MLQSVIQAMLSADLFDQTTSFAVCSRIQRNVNGQGNQFLIDIFINPIPITGTDNTQPTTYASIICLIDASSRLTTHHLDDLDLFSF